MTVELISAIAGILISLILEFVPGVEGWYNKFSKQQKRLVMLVALFVVVGGAFGLSCANLIAIFACTTFGVWQAVMAFIAALVANQSVHLVLKKDNS
ncbi:MAG: hypothetical protein IMY80_07620 [Chloroflexi bacterium]|nr:hypothetical protein [Chloroflexota bacterium]